MLLGHDLEDEEEAEANSPYLLQSSHISQPQQALQGTTTEGGNHQQLLTSGLEEEPKEDATAQMEGRDEGRSAGADSRGGAGGVDLTAEGVGALVAKADGGVNGGGGSAAGAAAVVEKGEGSKEDSDDVVGEEADVVVNTRTVRYFTNVPGMSMKATLVGQAVGWVCCVRCCERPAHTNLFTRYDRCQLVRLNPGSSHPFAVKVTRALYQYWARG